jgi:GNAT superfamily N-acetyltransferase
MSDPVFLRDSKSADDAFIGEMLIRSYAAKYAEKMPEVYLPPERLADLRDVERKRRTGGTVLVAEIDGQIAGTVTLYPPGHEESEAWLPNYADLRYFVIDLPFQGRGLSRVILEAAHARIWSWGCDGICLHVRRGAHGVARTYVTHGYRRASEGDMEKPTVLLDGYVLERPAATRRD